MNLDKLFYKYLILHKHGGIPGVGTFSIERKSAQSNFNAKSFTAPAYRITFAQGNAVADKHLYDFIAEEDNVDDLDAIRMFSDFSYNLKEKVHASKRVELHGIGTLTENAFGEYELQPLKIKKEYFPAVIAERIDRESKGQAPVEELIEANDQVQPLITNETEINAKKKDDWWIYAIILALLAIAAIGYYYLQNGSLR